jgi:hypothetical protein
LISSTLSLAAASHFGRLIFWHEGIAPHHDAGIASDAAILTLVFEM